MTEEFTSEVLYYSNPIKPERISPNRTSYEYYTTDSINFSDDSDQNGVTVKRSSPMDVEDGQNHGTAPGKRQRRNAGKKKNPVRKCTFDEIQNQVRKTWRRPLEPVILSCVQSEFNYFICIFS